MTRYFHYHIFLTVVAIFSFTTIGHSQCDGPFMNGDPIELQSDSITTTLSESDFYFKILGSGEVIINSLSGLTFLEGNSGEVQNLSTGDDIGPASTFSSGPLLVFNITTLTGPFGGGIEGFIGVLKDGKYGWIELADCGNRSCSPDIFEYRIINRCLNGVPELPIIAGDENSLLPPTPIPTLSQWSLIVLMLIMIIIGTLFLTVTTKEFRITE